MNCANLCKLASFIKGDFKLDTGKLIVSKTYNEVMGTRLDVSIRVGGEELKVYGLNDGHRGYGWIHYSEKVEKDLLKILDDRLKEQEDKEKESLSKRAEEIKKEAQRVANLLSQY